MPRREKNKNAARQQKHIILPLILFGVYKWCHMCVMATCIVEAKGILAVTCTALGKLSLAIVGPVG